MNSYTILNYMDAEPFQPFCIKMDGGETFEIPHPEMIMIGKSTVQVVSWGSDADPPIRRRELSLSSIESVEPLDAPAH